MIRVCSDPRYCGTVDARAYISEHRNPLVSYVTKLANRVNGGTLVSDSSGRFRCVRTGVLSRARYAFGSPGDVLLVFQIEICRVDNSCENLHTTQPCDYILSLYRKLALLFAWKCVLTSLIACCS